MNSIKQRLIAVLISGNLLVLGLGLFYSHAFITQHLNRIFDDQLYAEAQVVRRTLSLQPQLSQTKAGSHTANYHRNLQRYYVGDYRVQVAKQQSGMNELIFSSDYQAADMRNVAGFQDFMQGESKWRAYGEYDEDTHLWILTAAPLKTRLKNIDALFMQLGVYLFFGFLIITQVISFAVYYGLKPVRQLASSIAGHGLAKRDISKDDTPEELSPIIDSASESLRHLKENYARESLYSSTIAHQLCRPLDNIHSQVKALLKAFPHLAENAPQLQENINEVQSIVEQMLVVHRIAPDAFLARFDDINLNQAVQNVLRELNPEIKSKGHNITLNCANTTMRGERYSIDVLIRHLIINAVQHSPPTSKIYISTQDYGDHIILEVMDSGPGISQQERVHILKRGYRTVESNPEQTGLGLGIVEKIARLHKSAISIGDSIFSSGTSVKVVFPKSP